MTFTRGNLQLRDHKLNNKRVLLFSQDRKRGNRFEAEVEVANVEVTGVASMRICMKFSKLIHCQNLDLEGLARTAILFHLKKLHSDPVQIDISYPGDIFN